MATRSHRPPTLRAIGGLVFAAAILLSGCSAQPSPEPEPPQSTLPELAPPLSAAEYPEFSGVAAISLDSTCTATLIDTGVPDGPAYLLSNGHCADGRNADANAAVLNAPADGEARFGLVEGGRVLQVSLPIDSVPFSGMKGLDVSIVKLEGTLADAVATGLHALPLAQADPAPGTAVVNVGVPTQDVPPDEVVLRRGECTTAAPVDVIEFSWYWKGSIPVDCPGIRGGSSGSPLVSDGEIVGMINTTTAGAGLGGDCWLGKPCELGADGATAVADMAYAVPVAGLRECFAADGTFGLGGDCPLDPGVITVFAGFTSFSPAQLEAGDAHPQVQVQPTVATEIVTGLAPATGARPCANPATYSTETLIPGEEGLTIPVDLPREEGFYLFCIAEPGQWDRAAHVVFEVDGTPPVRPISLSINRFDESAWVEPLFSPPELSDFRVKFGAKGTVDCAVDEGYQGYRRVPFTLEANELPATFCVIGYDMAGNASKPKEFTIDRE